MSAPTERSRPPVPAAASAVAERGAARIPGPRAAGRAGLWCRPATGLLSAGVVGSLLGATAVHRAHTAQEHRAFLATSAQISATVQLALRHEQDLVTGAESYFLVDPGATAQQFVRWARSMQTMARYPELQGLGEARIVPAADLAAYERRTSVVRAAQHAPEGSFAVFTSGRRPPSCVSVVAIARSRRSDPAAGFDVCAGMSGHLMLAARDSGSSKLETTKIGRRTAPSLAVPVHRGGVVPPTERARRAGFAGLVGMRIVPDVIFGEALAGHRGAAVELRFGSGPSTVVLRSGPVPRGAQLAVAHLTNGWTLRIYESAGVGGLTGDAAGMAIALGGGAFAFLLAVLVYVLGTGRARALAMVRERTDALAHEASHDPLTGLANRSLVLERIGQVLARARRTGAPACP